MSFVPMALGGSGGLLWPFRSDQGGLDLPQGNGHEFRCVNEKIPHGHGKLEVTPPFLLVANMETERAVSDSIVGFIPQAGCFFFPLGIVVWFAVSYYRQTVAPGWRHGGLQAPSRDRVEEWRHGPQGEVAVVAEGPRWERFKVRSSILSSS